MACLDCTLPVKIQTTVIRGIEDVHDTQQTLLDKLNMAAAPVSHMCKPPGQLLASGGAHAAQCSAGS